MAHSLQSPLPTGTLVPQTTPSRHPGGSGLSHHGLPLTEGTQAPRPVRQVIQIIHPEFQTLTDPGDSEGGDPGEGPGVPWGSPHWSGRSRMI